MSIVAKRSPISATAELLLHNDEIRYTGKIQRCSTAVEHCYVNTVDAVALFLSVCLSQAGVLPKRLNVVSRKQHLGNLFC